MSDGGLNWASDELTAIAITSRRALVIERNIVVFGY